MTVIGTPKEKVIFAFVHIEKAAGITVKHILRRNFLGRYVDVRPLEINSQKVFSYNDFQKYLRINPFITCIGGHSVKPFSDLNSKYKNIKYFTLLRNPVKRYVSQFIYLYNINRIPNDFNEFILNEEYHNLQTKKLAGSENLDDAISSLHHMIQVGAVEEFDTFLLRLKKSLYPYGKFVPYYSMQNITKKNIDSNEIIDKYNQKIIQCNKLDMDLYEYVWNTYIPKLNKEYGDQLNDDLLLFEKANNYERVELCSYIDYCLRKFYYEPVTNFARIIAGMSAKGSY